MTNSERTREHEDAFWLDGETLIVREEPRAKPVYDLEERTARFGEAVIDLREKDSARSSNRTNHYPINRGWNERWCKLHGGR